MTSHCGHLIDDDRTASAAVVWRFCWLTLLEKCARNVPEISCALESRLRLLALLVLLRDQISTEKLWIYNFNWILNFRICLLPILSLVWCGGVYLGNTVIPDGIPAFYVIICPCTALVSAGCITEALKIGILHEFLRLLQRKLVVVGSSWVTTKLDTKTVKIAIHHHHVHTGSNKSLWEQKL